MRAGQREMRLLVVIELPQVPAIRRMAAVAMFAQPALMNIRFLVAVIAIRPGILELLRQMTLRTWHGDMQTHQRKISQIVIETNIATPGIRHMTLLAMFAQLTAVCILSAMTADAGRAQFLGSHICRMTGIATQPAMGSSQCELGIARMLKSRRLPVGTVMTCIALLAHAASM